MPCLPTTIRTGLSIGYVWTGPKPWKPCARTHGTCVRWNRIELPSSHSDSAHGEWTQPVFTMRSHLPSCVSPTQERRHASFSSPVKHHARMADIKRIDGGHIDEHHRMCPCNHADGAQMTFLQRMLLGGDDDQRLFVPNAARVFQQRVDIAGPVHSRCNAVSKVRSNCAGPPLNGTG